MKALAYFCIILVLLPIVFLAMQWADVDRDLWAHLLTYRFFDLVSNTLVLLVSVLVGTLFLGVFLAYLLVFFNFPGRRFFQWALMLPITIPGYIFAFVVIGLFDFSGMFGRMFSGVFGVDVHARSTSMMVAVFVLGLYPYVYILSRSAFLRVNFNFLDAALLAGLRPYQVFFKVVLPIASSGVMAGALLVVMEVLSDFGVVSVFNYDTFTTLVYQVWFSMFSLPTAAQLSTVLLLLVGAVLVVFTYSKKQLVVSKNIYSEKNFYFTLQKGWGILACVFCGLVFFLAFALPVLQLLYWSFLALSEQVNFGTYLLQGLNSLYLSLWSAVLVVLIALFLCYAKRGGQFGRLFWWCSPVLSFGYALPGTVLAVAVMAGLVQIDYLLGGLFAFFGVDGFDFWLRNSVLGLLLAYIIKMMAPAFGAMRSGMDQVGVILEEKAMMLGASKKRILTKVFAPIMAPSILSGFLMVFIDVMGELPVALLLRPFGWETLAVGVFNFTSESQWVEAALPALLLVCLTVITVWYLNARLGERKINFSR